MSQQDVDLALAFVAAYNARDLDAAVELCSAEVCVSPDASIFPEAASLVGRDMFRAFMEETWSAWASASVTPTQVLDIADGRVVVQADWGATGAASGVETYTNLTQLYTIREGQICAADYFFDHDEALKAAGLAR